MKIKPTRNEILGAIALQREEQAHEKLVVATQQFQKEQSKLANMEQGAHQDYCPLNGKEEALQKELNAVLKKYKLGQTSVSTATSYDKASNLVVTRVYLSSVDHSVPYTPSKALQKKLEVQKEKVAALNKERAQAQQEYNDWSYSVQSASRQKMARDKVLLEIMAKCPELAETLEKVVKSLTIELSVPSEEQDAPSVHS